jgi:iron(III) transport system ATP-binding protein
VSELVVTGLEKAFDGTPVLRGVDLVVPEGTLAAVLGPSGCGKTTLLRVVAGFAAPDAGTVSLGGRLVSGPGTAVPPERRRVGVVPQEGALFPHLSVADNVGFGLSRAARRGRRVAEVLELVGLDGYERRMPGELSGGQQQRVALARALAPEPDLVLLDEPFSALDTGLRAALREDVRAAVRATGATAVLVTHDQEEALSMADLVAVVREGRVVQAAPPAELYTAPRDLGVATFVGDAVVVSGEVADGVVRTALGSLPVRAVGGAAPSTAGALPGKVVIRPEQLAMVDLREGVPARVAATTFFGHDALVHLTLTDGSAVDVRTLGPHGVAPGDDVGLAVLGPVSYFPDAV